VAYALAIGPLTHVTIPALTHRPRRRVPAAAVRPS
jgi:hypothetical protein